MRGAKLRRVALNYGTSSFQRPANSSPRLPEAPPLRRRLLGGQKPPAPRGRHERWEEGGAGRLTPLAFTAPIGRPVMRAENLCSRLPRGGARWTLGGMESLGAGNRRVWNLHLPPKRFSVFFFLTVG